MSTTAKPITRRSALKSLGATSAFVAIGGGGISLFSIRNAGAISAPQTGTDTVIVTVFLRGAMDGLSLVAPSTTTDPLYAATDAGALRPRLNIATGTAYNDPTDPDSPSLPPPLDLTDANGQSTGFILNGVATGMFDLWNAGELAIVHAVGSDSWPRSHFSAMDKMDRARGGANSSGWLIRALAGGIESLDPWTGIGAGSSPNPSLRSSTAGAAPAVPSIAQMSARRTIDEDRRGVLRALYANTDYGPLLDNGLATTDLIFDIANLEPAPAVPYHPASGPNSGADRLADAARLINGDKGVRAIAIDTSGWDTHSNQHVRLPPLLGQLSESLKRFWDDLDPASKSRTVVVVMSEFGRTALENGGRGTEHGTGNCMLVMGASDRLNGQQVHLKHDIWPGLGPAASYDSNSPVAMGLFEDQDLQATTDFRDVFAEVIEAQFGTAAVASALTDYVPQPVGLFASVKPTIKSIARGRWSRNGTDPVIVLSWNRGSHTPNGSETVVQVRREGTAEWQRFGRFNGTEATDFEIYKEAPNTPIGVRAAYEVRIAWRRANGSQSAWTIAGVGPER